MTAETTTLDFDGSKCNNIFARLGNTLVPSKSIETANKYRMLLDTTNYFVP